MYLSGDLCVDFWLFLLFTCVLLYMQVQIPVTVQANKFVFSIFYLILICSESGTILTQMSTGDFFGEIGILNLDGGINR